MEQTKKNITKIVENYIRLFPDEYAIAIKGTKMLREMSKDQFASIDGMFDGRALFEMPETLHQMLVNGLTQEELTWLKEGGKNRKEGARWFARTFRQFAIAKSI